MAYLDFPEHKKQLLVYLRLTTGEHGKEDDPQTPYVDRFGVVVLVAV